MINPKDFVFKVRSDFSMVALDKRTPFVNGNQPKSETCYNMTCAGLCTNSESCPKKLNTGMCSEYLSPTSYDRNNSANDGYCLGSKSKVKIRTAVNALYMSNIENRNSIRFVTFTFPPLPDDYLDKDIKEQDQFLYTLFKRFLNNERNNYGLNRYVWVNERQQRGVIHFHCLFEYSNPINYAETNVRFLNLLRRNRFNIYSADFLADTYADRRTLINQKLSDLDYSWFQENPEYTKYTHAPKTVVRGKKSFVVTSSSVFLQPVDFEKPIADLIQLAYYLSKYISKDDEKEKIYCRRWASSRGLTTSSDDAFIEFDNETLVEIYRDIPQEQKEKGGYKEKELIPLKFEYTIDGKTYVGWYFPPVFRKWASDPSMVEYFRDKFKFYLTN